jgi:hypothetical protein
MYAKREQVEQWRLVISAMGDRNFGEATATRTMYAKREQAEQWRLVISAMEEEEQW